MSRGHRTGHHASVEETLAGIAQQEIDILLALLGNRVEQTAASGTTVAAGGAITLDASLVLVPTVGGAGPRVKVTATTSFTSGAGTVTPFLQTGINGGPLATQWSWDQTSDGAGSIAVSFVLSLAPGTASFQAHWQTTAGDALATLGHGVAGNAASLLLEQVP